MQKKKTYPILRIAVLLAAVVLGAGASTKVEASMVTFSASGVNPASDNSLSASATFSVSGNQLTVLLENTGSAASVPSDVLTALYFSIPNATLTPVSATIPSSGTLLNSVSGQTLGGGWQYIEGTGIGGSGLGIFGGASGFFAAPNNPSPLDGIDYGLVNGVSQNANTPVLTTALVEPSVLFTFDITGSTVDLTRIKGLQFQYGTSTSEPLLTPVPEPGTILAGALSLFPLGMLTLRTLRRSRAEDV